MEELNKLSKCCDSNYHCKDNGDLREYCSKCNRDCTGEHEFVINNDDQILVNLVKSKISDSLKYVKYKDWLLMKLTKIDLNDRYIIIHKDDEILKHKNSYTILLNPNCFSDINFIIEELKQAIKRSSILRKTK